MKAIARTRVDNEVNITKEQILEFVRNAAQNYARTYGHEEEKVKVTQHKAIIEVQTNIEDEGDAANRIMSAAVVAADTYSQANDNITNVQENTTVWAAIVTVPQGNGAHAWALAWKSSIPQWMTMSVNHHLEQNDPQWTWWAKNEKTNKHNQAVVVTGVGDTESQVREMISEKTVEEIIKRATSFSVIEQWQKTHKAHDGRWEFALPIERQSAIERKFVERLNNNTCEATIKTFNDIYESRGEIGETPHIVVKSTEKTLSENFERTEMTRILLSQLKRNEATQNEEKKPNMGVSNNDFMIGGRAKLAIVLWIESMTEEDMSTHRTEVVEKVLRQIESARWLSKGDLIQEPKCTTVHDNKIHSSLWVGTIENEDERIRWANPQGILALVEKEAKKRSGMERVH